MRVLLRNLDTGAYYAGSDRWVRAPSQAYDFVEVEAANRAGGEARLGRVELVLAYDLTGLRSRFSGSDPNRSGGHPARRGAGRPARRPGRSSCSRARNLAHQAGPARRP